MGAALALEEMQERTGLSVEELEMKVKDLEKSVSRLEPVAREVVRSEAHLTELNAQNESLVEEIARLEERHETFKENVRDKEQRETELSNRVRNLEDRAQSADERLTNTREDLQTLSGIGMSPDNLSTFAQRFKVVAQHHDMKPETVCSRLMDVLEQLDEGLRLDTIVEEKPQKLQQERSSLEATLSEERRYIIKDINTVAENTITKLKQDLAAGVRGSVIKVSNLKNQALQLGKELGQFNAMVESNKWLKGLQALINGDKEVEPDQIRIIGITVMKASLSWLEHHYQDNTTPHMLRSLISNLISEFERWKPQLILSHGLEQCVLN